MSFTRRSMLKATLAALPGHAAARDLGQLVRPAMGIVPVDAARAFLANEVRLLPGSPFYVRQELHRKGVLVSYDPDRLLYHYRALAKLPQKEGIESGYDGWDSGFIRGHMTGHYLSAASRMAVATGSTLFRHRVNYLVGELAKCQAKLNLDGYLAAFSPAAFDQLEGKPGAEAGDIGVPYYTIQKIMSGLLDAHAYLGNKQALEVATRMADYFGNRLAALNATQIDRMLRTDDKPNPQNEFGAMSDVLTEVFKIGKDARHLQAARMFNRAWFVGPLAAGEDRLGGLHANTHIAQAVGLANCANAHGNPVDLSNQLLLMVSDCQPKFWCDFVIGPVVTKRSPAQILTLHPHRIVLQRQMFADFSCNNHFSREPTNCDNRLDFEQISSVTIWLQNSPIDRKTGAEMIL